MFKISFLTPQMLTSAVILAASIVLVNGIPPSNHTTQYRACQPPKDKYAFCNTSLSVSDRAEAVYNLLNITEYGPLLSARGFPRGNVFNLERLGIDGFDWGENSLHGNQVLCIDASDGKSYCPTSFPMPNALGAAWNSTVSRVMGATIGLELRALWLAGSEEASTWSGRARTGLDVWSPTINLPHDGRWGRFQEVPSEEPLILGDYGATYSVGAMWDGPSDKFPMSIPTVKHFAAYSLEDSDGFTRHTFNAIVSAYEMAAIYLPGFEYTFRAGGATGVMCS